MKLKDPRISIQINQDATYIEVYDSPSGICFLEIELTPEQLSSALSRLHMTECKAIVKGLDRIGKKMIMDTIVFPFDTTNLKSKDKEEEAVKACNEALLLSSKFGEGWVSDNYFGAQDSFFSKEGVGYAKTTVRNWIDEEG